MLVSILTYDDNDNEEMVHFEVLKHSLSSLKVKNHTNGLVYYVYRQGENIIKNMGYNIEHVITPDNDLFYAYSDLFYEVNRLSKVKIGKIENHRVIGNPTTFETSDRQLYVMVESEKDDNEKDTFSFDGKYVQLVNVIHKTLEVRWIVRVPITDSYDQEALNHFGLNFFFA